MSVLIENYNKLDKIRTRFHNSLGNKNITYVYIAPKDEKEFERFISLVNDMRDSTYTKYIILTTSNLEILQEHFLDTTSLELYISINDGAVNVEFKQLLRQYIKEKKINFTVNW